VILSRPACWLLFGLLLAGGAWSAEAPPEFTLEGVGGARAILTPGAIGTIYGQHLGAAGQCIAPPSVNPPVYPIEICGTQVFVGDEPAGLLYVSEKQINFQVPKDGPECGTADLRVVYNGQWSQPLTMKAGFEKMTIRLDQPAYTDMAVWLKVDFRSESRGGIQYPSILGPAGFGCNQVEVRRDGKLLARMPGSNWNRGPIMFGGNICGGYGPTPHGFENRLPLHLVYRFDEPGTYEVRYTLRDLPFGGTGPVQIKIQSEWTPIEVLPANHYQRAQWLEDVRNRHPMDAAELLSDVLPSVLGLPDEASLEIVRSYLDHPDENVRRFAANGLYYWPEGSIPQRPAN
jgi:hypothetical protein